VISNKIHGIAEGTFEGLKKLIRLSLENNFCADKEYGDF
jgi:hypothetical protein